MTEALEPVQSSGIARETPEVDQARAALVKQWLSDLQSAENHWKPVFDRMREDMEYVRLGASKAWVTGRNYTVPIINRHINRAVSTLYARNPKAKAKLRDRVWYKLWDEDPGSLQADIAVMQQTGMPTPMLAEIQQVEQQKRMLTGVARTLEVLFNYFTSEQSANFKLQMKQLVRRTKTTGVGYLWLDFQRILEKKPDIVEQIADVTSKLSAVERMAADAQDGITEDSSAEVEQLRTSLADLQNQVDMIVREGPVFDFPKSTDILVDPCCSQLRGFIGARWIARKFDMDPKEVQEVYKVDVRNSYKSYTEDGKEKVAEGAADKGKARVYVVFDKKLQQTFAVCEGYPDFLAEPAAPRPQLERFWPVFVLSFNDVEAESAKPDAADASIYPPSDVHFLKSTQDGYNSARQGLREHRHANRPKYATAKGRLEEPDKAALQSHPANAIIELNALASGEKVADLLQRFDTVPIDPALYETASFMDDLYRAVGSHEAQLGGTSGDTATEVSVAESGRMESSSSNVDDLDEFLSETAHATGQLMLMELSPQTAMKLAGPGAQWPELNRQQIAEDLELQIKAGSSGRPNRAAELANMERGMPFLIQIPGLNPTRLGEKYSDLLELSDDGGKDFFLPSMPSIVALNAMASKPSPQPGNGDPASDPGAQGDAGAENAPAAGGNEQQSQPAYPADAGVPPGV